MQGTHGRAGVKTGARVLPHPVGDLAADRRLGSACSTHNDVQYAFGEPVLTAAHGLAGSGSGRLRGAFAESRC